MREVSNRPYNSLQGKIQNIIIIDSTVGSLLLTVSLFVFYEELELRS